MTLDEAIRHAEEVAEQMEKSVNVYGIKRKYMPDSHKEVDCTKCAAEHRQLAEWLTELKELRSIVDACNILAVDAFAVENLCKELKEAKKLLKAAVEDMYNSVNDVHCKYCSKWHTEQCQRTSHLDCYIENKFKWRYADEALKLIGGNENG